MESEFLDTEEQKIFYRMCQPNINVRRVNMTRLTETTSPKSLTNAILCDPTKALAGLQRTVQVKGRLNYFQTWDTYTMETMKKMLK